MPFPRSVLDICIVFPRSEIEYEHGMNRLLDVWLKKEWIDESRKQRKSGLLQGDFLALQVDPPDRVRLYANHQGGYRVLCPEKHRSIARDFSTAITHWRNGGESVLHCSVCQQKHALDEVITRPKAHFSRGAVILRDVSSISLSAQAKKDIEDCVGPFAVVYKRVG